MSSGFVRFLDHWWNLPYLVLLLLAAAYIALQLLGGIADLAHAHAPAHGHDAHGPLAMRVLAVCVLGGFAGLATNRVAWLVTEPQGAAWMFPLSLAAAFAAARAGLALVARIAARVAPADATATSRRALVGQAGVVASAALDARHGEVRVSAGPHELIVHARVPDDEPALARGDRVVLIELDAEHELFVATALPAD